MVAPHASSLLVTLKGDVDGVCELDTAAEVDMEANVVVVTNVEITNFLFHFLEIPHSNCCWINFHYFRNGNLFVWF
jgi:hypothetical protein